jgi:hypothetical protein
MFLMLDVCGSSNLEDNVDAPMSAFVYTISTLHCMTVSLAHGGTGLGTAWGAPAGRANAARGRFHARQDLRAHRPDELPLRRSLGNGHGADAIVRLQALATRLGFPLTLGDAADLA